MEENNCEVCGKDCEYLVGKLKYKGNTDTRMMCLDCFKHEHEEDFDDN